ncbi:MAG: DUF4381 domain-containing protein [Myxococcota bacterium]
MPRPDFLRDGFGALGLPGWEEIYVPEPVPMTPQTIGWVLLGIALASLVVWGAARAVRVFRQNRYRRAALRELDAIRLRPQVHATQLPALLKRTALVAFRRAEVASLSGAAWVAFLERTCPSAGFDGATGDALIRLSYRGQGGIPSSMIRRLLDVSEAWIRGHRAGV